MANEEWNEMFEDYSQRRKERLRKIGEPIPDSKYEYLGGEKAPIRLRNKIYEYLPVECEGISNYGKRCSKAFTYIDEKGDKQNCVNYCMDQ